MEEVHLQIRDLLINKHGENKLEGRLVDHLELKAIIKDILDKGLVIVVQQTTHLDIKVKVDNKIIKGIIELKKKQIKKHGTSLPNLSEDKKNGMRINVNIMNINLIADTQISMVVHNLFPMFYLISLDYF